MYANNKIPLSRLFDLTGTLGLTAIGGFLGRGGFGLPAITEFLQNIIPFISNYNHGKVW